MEKPSGTMTGQPAAPFELPLYVDEKHEEPTLAPTPAPQPAKSKRRSVLRRLLFGGLALYCAGNVVYRHTRSCGHHASDPELPHIGSQNPAVLVKARHGAVASENKRCSDIGVDVLKDGGNAVDAAIATSLCIDVVNPFACVAHPYQSLLY